MVSNHDKINQKSSRSRRMRRNVQTHIRKTKFGWRSAKFLPINNTVHNTRFPRRLVWCSSNHFTE